MFALTDLPIILQPAAPLHPHAGGIVTFEGRVRATNEGKAVNALDYEVYQPLALREGNAIVAEALARVSLFSAQAVHRYGHLHIGDVALWVHVAGMHRREAFAAAEVIIHEIKHRLPIWKKEWYADGSGEWVRCHHGA